MGSRRKAREAALQILYQRDMTGEDLHDVLSLYWEKYPATPEVQGFAEHLVAGIWRNRDEIDDMIRKHSTHWRLERMSIVDRNILRMGTYELLFEHDIAPSVSLNEAIEIAKRFGTEESGAFVNGILDPIARAQGEKS